MDISKRCRGCLKIVRSTNLEVGLLDKFIFCTRLRIAPDCEFPKKFCHNCSTAIKSAYSFIKIAHQIDDKLKSLIPKVVPSVKEELDDQTNTIIGNLTVENIDVKNYEDNFNKEHSIKDDFDAQSDHNFANDFNNIDYIDDKSLIEASEEKIDIKVEVNTKNSKKTAKGKNDSLKRNTKIKKETPVCENLKENTNSHNDFEYDVTLSNSDNKTDIELAEETLKKRSKKGIKTSKKRSKMKNKTPVRKKLKKETPGHKSLREKKPISATNKPITKYEYLCKICSRSFEKELWLRNHIPNAHPETEDVAENMIIKWGEEELRENVSINSQGRTEYTCPFCMQIFTRPKNYLKHIKNKKFDVEQRTCAICKVVLKSPCHQSRHLYTAHSGKKNYECKICGKTYIMSESYEAHNEMHKNIGTVICDTCKAEFNNKYDLTDHMKSHVQIVKSASQRNILCDFCGQTYETEQYLKVHMSKHTNEKPLKCSQCPFRAAYRSSMRIHELRHRGEKRKQCPLCPKKFYEACTLARHIRCHTGERPFQCPHCERAFGDSWKRKSHMMHTHHIAFGDIPRMDRQGNALAKI